MDKREVEDQFRRLKSPAFLCKNFVNTIFCCKSKCFHNWKCNEVFKEDMEFVEESIGHIDDVVNIKQIMNEFHKI